MPHPVDVHIGLRLREARTAAGLSQSDIAEHLGISFQQVQKYAFKSLAEVVLAILLGAGVAALGERVHAELGLEQLGLGSWISVIGVLALTLAAHLIVRLSWADEVREADRRTLEALAEVSRLEMVLAEQRRAAGGRRE